MQLLVREVWGRDENAGFLTSSPVMRTQLARRPHRGCQGFSKQTKNEDNKSAVGLSPKMALSASCSYLLLKQPRTSWVPPQWHPENPEKRRIQVRLWGAPGVTGGRLDRGFGMAGAGQEEVRSWGQWTRCLRGPRVQGCAGEAGQVGGPHPETRSSPSPDGGALHFRVCLSLKLSYPTRED